MTARGSALWGRIRSAIGDLTQAMGGDLPADDLAAAARVLNTVPARANAAAAAA